MSINTSNDDAFLIWIAKRLVNKYGENKEIVSIVESIIEKNRILISSLDISNTSSLTGISNAVNILISTKKQIENNNKIMVDEFAKLKNKKLMNNFENIDINSLI